MTKNIVVFSDGTAKDGGVGSNTNVYKLFNMIEDRTDNQIAFYDRGLGTNWRRVTGNAFGMGISRNIIECYEFIFEHYNAGDRVFLFGFSRGATTVRSLSGFIHLFGILPKSRPELIERAYKIYQKRDRGKSERLAREFVERHHNMWCPITFIGVWDTVAALGLPFNTVNIFVDKVPWFRHRFHNLRLSDSVQHARHAVAIDDERLLFQPVLWAREVTGKQSMKQVWFCGMHSDVGGGYPEQQLSDIALDWMVQEAQNYGLRIYPHHKVKRNPDPNGEMHNSRSGLSRLFRRRVRSWDIAVRGKPTVHESVKMRNLNKTNSDASPYEPWILKLEPEVEPWHRQVGPDGLPAV